MVKVPVRADNYPDDHQGEQPRSHYRCPRLRMAAQPSHPVARDDQKLILPYPAPAGAALLSRNAGSVTTEAVTGSSRRAIPGRRANPRQAIGIRR